MLEISTTQVRMKRIRLGFFKYQTEKEYKLKDAKLKEK